VIDLDNPRYTVSQAAVVSGLTIPTGRSWIPHLWLTEKDRKAAVAGATTLLTARRVLQMAIGAELAKRGVHPRLACHAALEFTDRADSYGDPDIPPRTPGELFDAPDTWTDLIHYDDGSAVVLPFGPADERDVLFPPGWVFKKVGRQDWAGRLRLNSIVKHVIAELDQCGRAGRERAS
jgi:hypothetical protein